MTEVKFIKIKTVSERKEQRIAKLKAKYKKKIPEATNTIISVIEKHLDAFPRKECYVFEIDYLQKNIHDYCYYDIPKCIENVVNAYNKAGYFAYVDSEKLYIKSAK